MGAEIRNPTTNETAQETVDRLAGSKGHPTTAPTPPPTAKAPGESIHPSAQGIYGAPLGSTILK